MSLPNRTFQNFVDAMVAQWSASLGFQPTLQDGDFLFALMQACASQYVFLQALAQLVNNLARAQTSTGADLDSFYAQFGFTRLPAQDAEGPVTFSNPATASSPIPIPVGTVVQTIGGAIQYAVIADTNQPTYNPTLNAYVLPTNATSLSATVQALEAGSASNVTAGQLAQIATPVPGINTVTNAEPITNGADAESDASFRARFVLFLNGLSKATEAAILSAITGVQQGLDVQLEENVDINGNPHPGEFVASIDDGTGSPPSSLITSIFNAVDAVRGFTIMPEVIAIDTNSVTVVLAIKAATGFTVAVLEAPVANAVVVAVNGTQTGTGLPADLVVAAALSVQGVASVQLSSVLLNGENADLAAITFQAYRTNINNVTVGPY